jgi:LysR family glycine cleavage system transcriptional activator
MPNAPSHLRSFQALELALRTGSLRAAAEALAITPAAVGQRVKALEDYLGVDLLARGRSGLRPAPSLAAAMPHLEAAFRELETAAGLLDMQRGQEIHVAAAPDFADLWLKPRLDAFRAEHPNVLFCINGEGEAALRLGPVDCEISFGAPRPGVEVLFGEFVLPISSPEIAGRLTRADSLEGFPLLHLDFFKDDPSAPSWPAWIARQNLHRTAPDRGIRFQRIARVLEAVLADAGLAICGLALLREPVEDGRLSLPFPISSGTITSHVYQARFRSDALARPQVRRFRDWLAGEAATAADWVAGLSSDPGPRATV